MQQRTLRVGFLAATLMMAGGGGEARSQSRTRPVTWSMSVQGEGLSASAEGDYATCCTVLTGYVYDRTPEEDEDEAIFTFPGSALGKLEAIAAGSYELKLGNFVFPGIARCTNMMNPMTVEITKGSPNAEGTFSGQVRCVDPSDPSVELAAAATLTGSFKLRK